VEPGIGVRGRKSWKGGCGIGRSRELFMKAGKDQRWDVGVQRDKTKQSRLLKGKSE